MTAKEYGEYARARSPRSPVIRDTAIAFVFGGLVCLAGEGLLRLWQSCGIAPEEARTWATVSLVFIAALLTVIGIYDDIAKHVGAGIVVPITGFANSIVSPAMEFRSEGLVLGLAAKMFVVAGPVLVYGIASGVVYGLVLVLLRAV